MSQDFKETVCISSEQEIVAVRRRVRAAAQELGFGLTDVTRIVTAASELARNVFLYAGSGFMCDLPLVEDERVGIELTFEDKGPGIADIEQAMQEGYSTSKGLGVGLPGTKRLVDEFEIWSEIGKGTRITVRLWLKG